MKKITLILLLLATKSQAQTQFFVGIGGAYSHNSIANKEDTKAPKEMLQQKGTFQASYGLQLGLLMGKHWEINLAPNFQHFKTTYSGKSDSLMVGPFNSSLALNYYNCPLSVNYVGHLSEKISIFGGLSFNVGYLKSYTEETKGLFLDPPNSPLEFTYKYTDKAGRIDFILLSSGKMVSTLDKPFYTALNLSAGIQAGIKYNLGDHIKILAQVQAMKGLTDIENKTKITETQYYGNSTTPIIQTYEAWKETRYYRSYNRPTSEYNKRPASTTLAIGCGLGIQYSFDNSNSSSNLY